METGVILFFIALPGMIAKKKNVMNQQLGNYREHSSATTGILRR